MKTAVKYSEHLRTSEMGITRSLHISHLMQYVSAYEPSKQQVEDLHRDLVAAIGRAAETSESQYVDQDGECFLRVSPRGFITLCLPWKEYELIPAEGSQLSVADVDRMFVNAGKRLLTKHLRKKMYQTVRKVFKDRDTRRR